MLCARALVRALNDAKNRAQQGCAMQFTGITLKAPCETSSLLHALRAVYLFILFFFFFCKASSNLLFFIYIVYRIWNECSTLEPR